MRKSSLFLVVAMATLGLSASGCNGKNKKYTIGGSVTILNDCDGKVASIPANVTIDSKLQDDRGQHIGGKDDVVMAAAAGANPKKTGTYKIKVSWGKGLGTPQKWSTPYTRNNACKPIPCASGTCQDGRTRVRSVPFKNPHTDYDITISCTCR